MTPRDAGLRAVPWRLPGAALIIAVGTYVLGTVSVTYFRVPGTGSTVWWPVAGLMLVILVRLPRRWWWVLLVVFGVVNGLANLPSSGVPGATTYAIVNVIEVVVAAVILRGSTDREARRLRTPREVARFVVALAVAVAVGAALVAVDGVVFPAAAPWRELTRGYVNTHTLGLVALAPLLLPGQSWWRVGWVRNIEFGAVLVVSAAVDVWAFTDSPADVWAFPALLPVVWAAIRLDPLRATVVSMMTCAFAAYGASRDVGVFASIESVTQREIVTQLFIATVAVTTLALVMITRHRARLAERASDSERTLKVAIQDALVGMFTLRFDGDRARVAEPNGALAALLGYDVDDLEGVEPGMLVFGPGFRSRSADDGAADAAAVAAFDAWMAAFARGRPTSLRRELTARTRAGESLWVEVAATRVAPSLGEPFALVHVHDLTGRREYQRQLERMALHDSLTALANRALLFRRLADELDRRAAGGSRGGGAGLLYVDLDGFKAINDTYGHAAGDAVLIEVSRRLTDAARASDTVARLGGDEFAVLCAGAGDDDALAAAGDRIRRALAPPIELGDGHRVVVRASIGLALLDGTMDADALVRAADTAMYREKHRAAVAGRSAAAE